MPAHAGGAGGPAGGAAASEPAERGGDGGADNAPGHRGGGELERALQLYGVVLLEVSLSLSLSAKAARAIRVAGPHNVTHSGLLAHPGQSRKGWSQVNWRPAVGEPSDWVLLT